MGDQMVSQLSEIWDKHQDQWQKIEMLEKNLEEAVMLKRRRIANLLDETPKFRKSHLRLFISYKTTVDQSNNTDSTDSGRLFEMIVEGKLLIGHLDHKRAKELDDALYGGQVNPDVDPSDRSQYRGGIAERESDIPVEPINFTHLFDKFQAVVYTVWQNANAKISTSKRQKGKRQASAIEDSLHCSPKTKVVWCREIEKDDSGLAGTSPDSHAFVIPYSCPATPNPALKFHSVVYELQLWPRMGDDILYKPSTALAKAIFPQHMNERTQSRGKKKTRNNLKQYSTSEKESIPTTNSLFVPSLLTMKEIVTAIFHYIQFKKLQDEHEESIIVCDRTLQLLFECERFNFADLQFLLTSKNLISDASNIPSTFTYIINKNSKDQQQLLSLDMDVNVPSLFHYRCRELLRRIKQREFEYTSSRTKARNWLMSGRPSEDKVRQLLEDCVTGQGYTSDHIGAWSALARAAPQGSEARQTAQIDAQICYILDRVEYHAKAAKDAWNVARAISGRNFEGYDKESNDSDSEKIQNNNTT